MGNMGKNGWIKLHRSMLDWQWYRNPATKNVFIHLMLTANWNNEPELIGRYEVGKGQTIITYPGLVRALGMTKKQARDAIGHLKGTGEVTVENVGNALLVTVLNFEKYQEGTVKGRVRAGSGPAQGLPKGTVRENLPIIREEIKKVEERKEKSAFAGNEIPEPIEDDDDGGWMNADELVLQIQS